MGWLVLIVLGGAAAYVLKPDERLRVARATLRPLEDLWFAYQDERARPDEFREALRARTAWPAATWAILVTYTLVFVAMGTHDDTALARWGGSVAPLTTGGEWWRLVTATFIHAGFIALLVDVVGLAQVGTLVERALGHTAFAVIYLSGAVIAGAIELSRHPLIVTVGPSGGILAAYGVLAAVLVRGLLRPSPLTIPVRALRRLAPAAAIFFLHAAWTGILVQPSGAIPLAVGFVFGFVLSRQVADGRTRVDRSIAVAIASLVIAAGIALPLRGIVDARPEIARVVAVEDRTSADYAHVLGQFKLGAIKGEAVARLIEQRIQPEFEQLYVRLSALGRVPPEQQALVAAAGEYVTLRRESWQLRARALHKSNMRTLRDADDRERSALACLERLRPPE